ncbi:MAG: dehydrogenase [Flavobacteriales bacterium]|nr:dehydrogenase [Flavobacteriales bacterium]
MPTTEELQLKYSKRGSSDALLKKMYRSLLRPRMIEEKMLILLRQGRISKWFSGIGQEAISVGTALALKKDEFMLPMHRNLGVFTTREIPLHRLFKQWQGKTGGFTNGRDRSFHFGAPEFNIVGMISHLGPQMGVADGIALANKLRKAKKVTAVFTGDGATSQGDFHESLNVAAVWDLPVIFIIENNGYGLSTPSSEQFKCKQFIDKAIGYGIEGVQVAGNNVLEVYKNISKIAEDIRKKPRPILVEMMTFRMRGHEEASGTKYVPKKLMKEWEKKDPIANFEAFLLKSKVVTEKYIAKQKVEIKKEIEENLDLAYAEERITPDLEKETKDIYFPHRLKTKEPKGKQEEMRLVDAISLGLRQSMEKHDNLILMGQDIADYGGVFKITEGFTDLFGKDRVRNTPLCEAAILGTGLGLSINGMKAMVEMQFADFVTEGFNQIINNLAKVHYRWGQNADVVVRMPTGAGVAAGPFHSQSNEAWFTHTPGLKVAYPAFPEDAKGLLATAFEDPNPVMFFEHKALYRSLKGRVTQKYFNIPFGKANLLQEGSEASIITYGMGVHWALKWAEETPDRSIDILDLRTLQPMDTEAICESVKKTGKAMVLHEDCLTGGIGGHISALINENCFEFLDAPVMRCASLDTPVPFAAELEDQFLASARLGEKMDSLLDY